MSERRPYKNLLLGGGTAIGIVIFLGIIVLVQFIAMRHPKRWDITRIGKYTLAPQSNKVLEDFRKRGISVEILAFYENRDIDGKARAKDLLDQYRDLDSSLTYSFLDPDEQSVLAIQNKVDVYPTLVIKAGKRSERVTTVDEETMTNALVKLLREETKKVYFLKGHGELSIEGDEKNGAKIAKEYIEKQNYKVGELVLLRSPSVPKDASILVIAGPQTDPMESELESIREYLKRGGKLMVLLAPFKTPVLTDFLKDFGFVTTDDIIIDQMSQTLGGDVLMPVVTSYAKFPITKNFTVASILPMARSVRVAKDSAPQAEPQELAFTSPMSWTVSEADIKAGKINFNPSSGEKGPIPVMAVSTYTNLESANKKLEETKEFDDDKSTGEQGPNAKSKSRAKGEADPKPTKAGIVVFGSAQFASDKFFRVQGNGDLFMNTISWLAEEEHLISIRPKSEHTRPLILIGNRAWTVFTLPLVLVPLAWVIVGVIVFIRRRRTVIV